MYDFSNKNIVIMGLGRFGGGLGVTRWMINAGANVTVTDTSDADSLQSSLTHLNDLMNTDQLRVVLGPHDPAILQGADMLIVNPAVPQPWENPFIQSAKALGILVTTEIQIALSVLPSPRVIAITGSAGKSTTSAMIHHVLSSTGHESVLAGNIGGSLLNHLDEINEETYVVLELSSAMLHWLWDTDQQNVLDAKRPYIACVTNFIPNHLDWHGDLEHYQRSKLRLLHSLPADGTAILSESVTAWRSQVHTGIEVINQPVDGCVLLGRHNAMNAAMAIQAVVAAVHPDADLKLQMIKAVQEYPGLPHRLNRCHVRSGVEFYNDSKSTVPDATIRAVDALSHKFELAKIHLIAGGYDKGSDLSSISELAHNLAGLYAIGATEGALCSNAGVNAYSCKTLEYAVQKAIKNAKRGDVIVLSPGCASWDQFSNYEERGQLFESLAKQCEQEFSC